MNGETISKITDEIVADTAVWQNRPLDAVYPVLLIDAITRQGSATGRPLTGASMLLSAWTRPANATCWACGSDPQAATVAKQWATMRTELRNRGLADALIVCCDGVCGLPESIRGTWPDATVDLRRAHGAQQPALRLAQALGPDHQNQAEIYTAGTVEAAEASFKAFRDDSEATYPAMIDSRQNSSNEFRPVGGVPRRGAPDRLHHQRRREPQRPVPKSRKTPRAFPQRASRHENPLSCSHHQTQEPREPQRQDQRLENHPEHTHNPLPRPDRRPHQMKTITAGYTKNLTVPLKTWNYSFDSRS